MMFKTDLQNSYHTEYLIGENFVGKSDKTLFKWRKLFRTSMNILPDDPMNILTRQYYKINEISGEK